MEFRLLSMAHDLSRFTPLPAQTWAEALIYFSCEKAVGARIWLLMLARWAHRARCRREPCAKQDHSEMPSTSSRVLQATPTGACRLGEAYLEKDEVGKAKEQFVEIANRCGGPCNDYELLVKAIAAHITGEEDTGW
jgi:hypothetical protein